MKERGHTTIDKEYAKGEEEELHIDEESVITVEFLATRNIAEDNQALACTVDEVNQ